jgi:hypothetical protein
MRKPSGEETFVSFLFTFKNKKHSIDEMHHLAEAVPAKMYII